MAERRSRRRFTAEFKAQAVKRLLEGGRGLAEVATELGLSTGQLSTWRTEHLAAGSAFFFVAAFVGATAVALLTSAMARRRLGAVGVAFTGVYLVNAPLQIFATSDWSDAVGVVVFVGLLAWVFALSVVLVVALRREAAAPATGLAPS